MQQEDAVHVWIGFNSCGQATAPHFTLQDICGQCQVGQSFGMSMPFQLSVYEQFFMKRCSWGLSDTIERCTIKVSDERNTYCCCFHKFFIYICVCVCDNIPFIVDDRYFGRPIFRICLIIETFTRHQGKPYKFNVFSSSKFRTFNDELSDISDFPSVSRADYHAFLRASSPSCLLFPPIASNRCRPCTPPIPLLNRRWIEAIYILCISWTASLPEGCFNRWMGWTASTDCSPVCSPVRFTCVA